ncbi:MAG TPA: hypothetical protein DCZ95_06850 [Verrucomicrobia bacterium]|nr:MAG: hypothetical protein A2X46_06075 [Lentisphaerae bacterium GWF2_57_35]HBA83793.1 hypothetical protein [Verrucomicrobiota bacterium]
METRLRSWVKSTSWRITGFVILGVISYAFTRNWKETTWITTIFHSLRFVLYYFHERWWAHISWGTINHPLSHLPVKPDLTTEDEEAVRNLLRERKCLSTPDYEI